MYEEAKELIKRFEDFREKTYLCPAGKETIGYGFTQAFKDATPYLEKGIITKQEALDLLDKIVSKIESCINSILKIEGKDKTYLNENEKGALISFVYNLGIGNLQFSTLFTLIVKDKTQKEAITKEFNKWVHSDGKVLKGLVYRRKTEAELFFKDI